MKMEKKEGKERNKRRRIKQERAKRKSNDPQARHHHHHRSHHHHRRQTEKKKKKRLSSSPEYEGEKEEKGKGGKRKNIIQRSSVRRCEHLYSRNCTANRMPQVGIEPRSSRSRPSVSTHQPSSDLRHQTSVLYWIYTQATAMYIYYTLPL